MNKKTLMIIIAVLEWTLLLFNLKIKNNNIWLIIITLGICGCILLFSKKDNAQHDNHELPKRELIKKEIKEIYNNGVAITANKVKLK